VDSRFHGNDGNGRLLALYFKLCAFYGVEILNLIAMGVPFNTIKLRVKYPFIGIKLKAKSRKQKNYLPLVIPNRKGDPRF